MSVMKYWAWLACMTMLRPKAKLIALEHFGGPEGLFFAGEEELKQVEGLRGSEIKTLLDKDLYPAMKALDWCGREEISLLVIGDSAYPRRLANIYDPPAVLFVRGRLPVMDEEAAVAVVGTRKSTPYGEKQARSLAAGIVRGGGLIVSGLAEGIDSAAARGALLGGGKCVGVLGTGIDVVYPRFNRPLFEDVCVRGAIVSEYPPGAAVSRLSFPARNRIISGLSLGVVVIEAPARSGALITAEHALEQGRDVFAVPGNADAESCAGSNALLRDCAKLTLNAWDVLGEYAGLFPEKISDRPAVRLELSGERDRAAREQSGCGDPPAAEEEPEQQFDGLTPAQLKIISVMDGTDMYADTIIERAELPAAAVMAELTMLQISGHVVSSGPNTFRLNIKTKRG